MQKEQLAAVHLHPRARLSNDDLRPRDYENYRYMKSKNQAPLLSMVAAR